MKRPYLKLSFGPNFAGWFETQLGEWVNVLNAGIRITGF
jgi:hypothetical protein